MFLTEASLGEILAKIYPNCEITSQFKLGKKRYDYSVKIKPEDSKLLPKQVAPNNEDITLLLEYNGHFHYTDNAIVSKESPAGSWEKLKEFKNTYLLAIPYWVQLDSRMIKYWFNREEDYSNGFPHGFISKKVILPGKFCATGVSRFLMELTNLPYDVTEEVVTSLIEKSKKYGFFDYKKSQNVGDCSFWRAVVMFLPEYIGNLGDLIRTCEPEDMERVLTVEQKKLVDDDFLLYMCFESYKEAEFHYFTFQGFLNELSRSPSLEDEYLEDLPPTSPSV